MQYCTVMPLRLSDLVTSTEAGKILPPTLYGKPRRIEPYHRTGRIKPVMRVGSGPRSPLLFKRRDVEKLRDELAVEVEARLANVKPT